MLQNTLASITIKRATTLSRDKLARIMFQSWSQDFKGWPCLYISFTFFNINVLLFTFILPPPSLSPSLPVTGLLQASAFYLQQFGRMNISPLFLGSGQEFIFVGQVFQNVIFDRNHPTQWIQEQTWPSLGFQSLHTHNAWQPCGVCVCMWRSEEHTSELQSR